MVLSGATPWNYQVALGTVRWHLVKFQHNTRQLTRDLQEPDEAPPQEKNVAFRERWDCISRASSDLLLDKVRARIDTLLPNSRFLRIFQSSKRLKKSGETLYVPWLLFCLSVCLFNCHTRLTLMFLWPLEQSCPLLLNLEDFSKKHKKQHINCVLFQIYA